MDASVRRAFAERRTCVGLASDLPETKIVAKRRTVVTFGLVSSLRVSKVSTVTGIGGVAKKLRNVITFGLVSFLRVSKVSTVTGIGGVVVAKRRIVVTLGLSSGERKGERREEKRYMRGEK